MLHPDYLDELVEIGGRALEQEDRFITGCVTLNHHLYGDGKPGGLLRFSNERYYQFIICRALMSAYRYRVTLEEERRDFVLRESATSTCPCAISEMKTWLSSRPETGLAGMRTDLTKLRTIDVPGFFLVATAWPLQEAAGLLEQLVKDLELTDAPEPCQYRFQTIGWPDAPEREFELLGFSILG